MNELIILLGLILTCLILGSAQEWAHYRSIKARERVQLPRPCLAARTVPESLAVASATMVVGSVVISLDYFRQQAMKLRKLFGGELKSYSTLLDRGRREALLRMKEAAPDADLFCNVRFDSAALGGKEENSVRTCVEITAYGTAVYLKK